MIEADHGDMLGDHHLWRHRMIGHLSERGRQLVSGGNLALRRQRLLYSPGYPRNSSLAP